MSQDESDSEEGLVTLRPEYRAKWVSSSSCDGISLIHSQENNLYDAIGVAQAARSYAKLGPNSRLPLPLSRRIELVRRPIPQLERGNGTSKVIVRIAFCALGKSWRNNYPQELPKYAHLINVKVASKPDISEFLLQYPSTRNDQLDPDSNAMPTESQVESCAIPSSALVGRAGDEADDEGGDEGGDGDERDSEARIGPLGDARQFGT
jgi:hypothetical protein